MQQFRAHLSKVEGRPRQWPLGVTGKLWEMPDTVKVLEDWENTQTRR
jgi:hypothetical protein